MRNPQFITEHRGGLLTPQNHKKLMEWAISCAEHVYQTLNKPIPAELAQALLVGKLWQQGSAKTGEAMTVARQVHKIVREYENPIDIAMGRAVGHAVATAHMADHCMGATLYGLKALKLAGLNIENEKTWHYTQLNKLPDNLAKLIKEVMPEKEAAFKLF